MVVLKELMNWFFTVSTLGMYGGPERTDFLQFLLWEGLVVSKELIYNSLYLGGMVVLKELILNSFYLGRVW